MDNDAVTDLDKRVSRTLFCKGLTQQVTQSILYELFLIAGPIQCIHLPRARPCKTKEVKQPEKSSKCKETTSCGKKPARQITGESKAIYGCAEELDADCEEDAEDGLVLNGKDHSQHIENVVDENGTRDVPTVSIEARGQDLLAGSSQNVMNSDEKTYSVEDKILYRYRLGEHQGYAFIIFCHVQSVDYAMNIFRGTKLFGSHISMSPAKQAMEKHNELSTWAQKSSNIAKCKTDVRCQRTRENNSTSHTNTLGSRRERRISSRNPIFQNDQIAFYNYDNSPPWYDARMAQTSAADTNYYPARCPTGYNQKSKNSQVRNEPRMTQTNWRVGPDTNQQGIVRGPDVTPWTAVSNGDQLQWRARGAVHQDLPNSFGNMSIAARRTQARAAYGNQRKTVLHPSIPQLGRGKFNRSQPIIESGSFLSLTPNIAQHEFDRRPHIAHPSVTPRCEAVNPPSTPLEVDKSQSKSPLLTLNADERNMPILFYETDTKPDIQTFSNVYPGQQTIPENWDLTSDNAAAMESLTLNQNRVTSEQCWDGGYEQFADPDSDKLSPHQLHYGNLGYPCCVQTTVPDLRSFSNVQGCYPNQVNSPCVQTEEYGADYEQWPPVLCVHVNNFTQPSHQIADQLNLLNLGHNSSRIPVETQPTGYRSQCRPINWDPSMMAYSECQALASQHTPFYGIESKNAAYFNQNTNEYLHRSQSLPCHVAQTKHEDDSAAMFYTKASRSSGRIEDPSNGHWVSPVTWTSKRHGMRANPKQYGAQNQSDRNSVDRANRPSRYYTPAVNKTVSSPRPGSSNRSERGYTLSECFDTAFEVYHQGNGVNSPRAKPSGGSSRKSSAV